MKKTFGILVVLITLVLTAPLHGQSVYDKYKKEQNAEFNKFKQDYANDIDKMNKLYKAYIDEEREMYRAFKNLGYIPQKVVDRVNKVEKIYPKQTTKIPFEESQQVLKISERKWKDLKVDAESTTQDKQEVIEFPDELIPLDDEEKLQVTDIVKTIEIAPVPKQEIKNEELQMEIQANRPIMCPLPKQSYRVSSPFNKSRLHPVLKVVRKHEGVDLAAPKGTKVYATADGVVSISKYSKSAGKYIVVNHQNGYTTSYMHLSKRYAKNGAKVKRGQLIGEVGTTGLSTGNHLHYEIRKYGDAFDPEPFIIKHF